MAYVVERKKDNGTARFLAQYRDPEGRIRSAGTHSSRRAAERRSPGSPRRVCEPHVNQVDGKHCYVDAHLDNYAAQLVPRLPGVLTMIARLQKVPLEQLWRAFPIVARQPPQGAPCPTSGGDNISATL